MIKVIMPFLIFILVPILIVCQSVRTVNDVPGQEIKIISGNPKLFEGVKNYLVEFDYSNLKVGEHPTEAAYIEYMKNDAELRKKGSSGDWERKWYKDRTEFFQPKFIKLFNENSNGRYSIDTSMSGKQYVINIETRFIEIGFNRNFKQAPTYISGIATISNMTNPEEKLIISFSYIRGEEAFKSYSAEFRRLEEAYAKCGKELAKFMRKVVY